MVDFDIFRPYGFTPFIIHAFDKLLWSLNHHKTKKNYKWSHDKRSIPAI